MNSRLLSKRVSKESYKIPLNFILQGKETENSKKSQIEVTKAFLRQEKLGSNAVLQTSNIGVLNSTARLQYLTTNEFLNRIKANNEKTLKDMITKKNTSLFQINRKLELAQIHKRAKQLRHRRLKKATTASKATFRSNSYVNTMIGRNDCQRTVFASNTVSRRISVTTNKIKQSTTTIKSKLEEHRPMQRKRKSKLYIQDIDEDCFTLLSPIYR